jgi:O-antigen/teichoic acid export membrane protein
VPGRMQGRAAVLGGLVHRVRQDPLVQNSAFNLGTGVATGAFGFFFWLVVARLYSPASVGVATTLVTAGILVAYASLMGFNSTFIRFLPTSANRQAEVDTGLVLVFAAALLIGTAYILGIPSVVPALRPIRANPAEVVAFVLLTGFAALNLLTDSIFIAHRASRFNFLIDGVAQSAIRLALPALLTGLGAFGIFTATGVAWAAAVALSLYGLRRFDYRVRLRIDAKVLRRVVRYSAANYVANGLTMLPVLVLPLIALRSLGAAAAGYWYVAFQIASLLFTVAFAVSQSLFAEGSYEGASLRHLAARAARLEAVIIVPSALLLAVFARWVLGFFGSDYREHALLTLVLLALSALPVALFDWATTLLRVGHQLRSLVLVNVIYSGVICALAAAWVHRGLEWVGGAWLLGNIAAGIAGVLIVFIQGRDAYAVSATDEL